MDDELMIHTSIAGNPTPLPANGIVTRPGKQAYSHTLKKKSSDVILSKYLLPG